MVEYTEIEIAQALIAIADGLSIRTAAQQWGIPFSTVRYRIKGIQPRALAFAGQQRLSPIQEKHLADWVRIQHALRLPPTHRQLKDFAERILQIAGDHRPLGQEKQIY
ncbi:hypothetical protein CI238_04498 [Colletotrichum incanum]|uniref:Transposase n=1 Tax=Colletotrichum incanum TaxID=1573173 RepID=A0A166LXT2_COLIC|nr:hypothetical protein CI238_04498 [Colletotrichum incanum]